jgi:hypothetical protein
MTGCVKGIVQASGTISGTPPSGCPRNWTPYSTPQAPKPQSLPEFTWDPANYPSTETWNNANTFKSSRWLPNKDDFSGVYRITDAVNTLTLDSTWKMSGDVTIVTDGIVSLTRDISVNASVPASSRPLTLTIVSLKTDNVNPVIDVSNNITVPSDIRVVFYANNGTVKFRNLKNLFGAVYAKSIQTDQQFTLTFAPVSIPGFAWNLASSTHFQIQARSFKEVPFS